MDSVVEGSFLASMESQEIQGEDEDAVEPVVARLDVIEDLIEVVSQ